METDAGDWTDRSFADVRAEAQELFDRFASADPSFAFPGGESFAEQEIRVEAALAEVERGPLPALVVCHGMVIRAAIYVRSGKDATMFQRVPNAAIVPLDPREAGEADLGSGAATMPS
jgi:broad specificity phosphatase PhoE